MMAKFMVEVVRTTKERGFVTVEADDDAEAMIFAIDEEGNLDVDGPDEWTLCDGRGTESYEAIGVELVEDK